MFLALRDLRFARGRFALMGVVIALLSLLVVLLSGLTAGLGDQSVAAIRTLPADHIALASPSAGGSVSFAGSRITTDQVRSLAEQPGVARAAALGISSTQADIGGHQVAIAAFGAEPGSFVAPAGLADGTAVLDRATAEDLGIAVGDTVTVEGTNLRVVGTLASATYSHLPVVWMPLSTWQQLASAGGVQATAVALRTTGQLAAAAAGKATGTVVESRDASFAAIGSYSAENGSLTVMRLLLLGVGALVVGAFFTVWTIQRTPDLAVLKAIGASTWYLVRDAAAQTLVLLLLGGLAGTLVAVVAGLAAQQVVPFVITPATTLVPLATMLAVGLVGGLAALRRITTVDPLTALGAAR